MICIIKRRNIVWKNVGLRNWDFIRFVYRYNSSRIICGHRIMASVIVNYTMGVLWCRIILPLQFLMILCIIFTTYNSIALFILYFNYKWKIHQRCHLNYNISCLLLCCYCAIDTELLSVFLDVVAARFISSLSLRFS